MRWFSGSNSRKRRRVLSKVTNRRTSACPTENVVGDFLPTFLTDNEMRSVGKFFVIGEGVRSLILGIFA
jgi:hypothetical protein